ncbi:MAG: hypothetical protein R2839_10850 [Thermomicrobiales bacterium]
MSSEPHIAKDAGFRRTSTTWAAYLMLGLFAYLETVVGPAMPFCAKLGLAFTMASVHFSLFAVGVIVAGTTTDRIIGIIGRRRGFWLGMAGMSAGGVLVAVSPVVAGTLLGVALMGFVGTWALISNQAILADTHRVSERWLWPNRMWWPARQPFWPPGCRWVRPVRTRLGNGIADQRSRPAAPLLAIRRRHDSSGADASGQRPGHK